MTPRPPPDLRAAPWFDSEAYPFSSNHMEIPSTRDGSALRLHYLDEGQGPPVVVVGGTPGWSYEWRHLVSRLRRESRVIVPDHLGMGLSDRHGDRGFPLVHHRRNLATLLSTLGIDRCNWVVHDFGGPIALPLLVESSGLVNRLVVMNSWMWDFESVQPSFGLQRRLLGSRVMSWLYRQTNLSAGVLMRQAMGRKYRIDRKALRPYTSAFPDAFQRAQVPAFLRALLEEGRALETAWNGGAELRHVETLLVWGKADPLVPPVHLERWRSDLPHAQVEELDEVGHFPHEEVPLETASLIDRFLSLAPPDP